MPEELEDDSQVDSAFNPDRTTIKRYELVHRDNTKNCPKKVQFRQSCPVPYTNTDVVLVKIFGQREFVMKNGVFTLFNGVSKKARQEFFL